MDEITLRRMLLRGDEISMRGGLLQVELESGNLVPEIWAKQIRELVFAELSHGLDYSIFRYIGYDTGCYDVGSGNRRPGVSLQFEVLDTVLSAYMSFNVELTRARTTCGGKKGSSLPKGQFRVGARHAFTGFWSGAGLPLPARLSAFHDCMGKLRGLLFTGVLSSGERLEKGSLRPLELSPEQVSAIIKGHKIPDNSLTTTRQAPDKHLTTLPDKESAESQAMQGVWPDSSARGLKCGIKVKGNTGEGETYAPHLAVVSRGPAKSPEDQTTDEWLSDYDCQT